MTLYTEQEYEIYRRVRALRAGAVTYGWKTVYGLVPPEEHARLQALVDEAAERRKAEIAAFAAEGQARRNRLKKARLNGYALAVLRLFSTDKLVLREQMKDAIARLQDNPDSRRTTLRRTLQRLEAEGYLEAMGNDAWRLRRKLERNVAEALEDFALEEAAREKREAAKTAVMLPADTRPSIDTQTGGA